MSDQITVTVSYMTGVGLLGVALGSLFTLLFLLYLGWRDDQKAPAKGGIVPEPTITLIGEKGTEVVYHPGKDGFPLNPCTCDTLPHDPNCFALNPHAAGPCCCPMDDCGECQCCQSRSRMQAYFGQYGEGSDA